MDDLKADDHSKNITVDGRLILKDFLYNKYSNLLLQHMEKRPACINTVINISINIPVLYTHMVGIRNKPFI